MSNQVYANSDRRYIDPQVQSQIDAIKSRYVEVNLLTSFINNVPLTAGLTLQFVKNGRSADVFIPLSFVVLGAAESSAWTSVLPVPVGFEGLGASTAMKIVNGASGAVASFAVVDTHIRIYADPTQAIAFIGGNSGWNGATLRYMLA